MAVTTVSIHTLYAVYISLYNGLFVLNHEDHFIAALTSAAGQKSNFQQHTDDVCCTSPCKHVYLKIQCV